MLIASSNVGDWELTIQLPIKFNVIVNLAVARRLRPEIPLALLALADRIFE
jgi:hypothetical protein